jgi:hypothetical protein
MFGEKPENSIDHKARFHVWRETGKQGVSAVGWGRRCGKVKYH